MVTLGSGGAGRAFSCADPELCGQVRSSTGVRAAGAGARAGAGAGAGGRAGGLPAASPLSGGPGSAPLARPQRPPPCPQLPPPPPSSRWAPRTDRNATSTSRSTGNRVSRGRPLVAECAAGPVGSGEQRGGADGRPPAAPAVRVPRSPAWLVSAAKLPWSRAGHPPRSFP